MTSGEREIVPRIGKEERYLVVVGTGFSLAEKVLLLFFLPCHTFLNLKYISRAFLPTHLSSIFVIGHFKKALVFLLIFSMPPSQLPSFLNIYAAEASMPKFP